MKKILLACGMLVLITAGVNAQQRFSAEELKKKIWARQVLYATRSIP